jgi:hypothetical protein
LGWNWSKDAIPQTGPGGRPSLRQLGAGAPGPLIRPGTGRPHAACGDPALSATGIRTRQQWRITTAFCVLTQQWCISLNAQTRNKSMMNIYVGNLPYGATEAELKTAFAAFGEVNSVNLIADKFTGQSKGFAFVEMADNASADAAIKGLNETPMGGRNLKVNQAKPRGERPARPPRW